MEQPWDLRPEDARALQRQLAGRVVREDRLGDLRRVAGLDLGFSRTGRFVHASDEPVIGWAALVVLNLADLAIVETQVAQGTVTFPYIPGLLSFRESPIALAAIAKVTARPDVLLVDGHGYAHPRRFGIACHLGVLLDLPTIGCAKSILVGRADEPGPAVGDWSPLVDRGEVVGAALRTRGGAKPVYVSVGHRVSLETAVDLTMRCARGYRLPEPTRLAHQLASAARAGGA